MNFLAEKSKNDKKLRKVWFRYKKKTDPGGGIFLNRTNIGGQQVLPPLLAGRSGSKGSPPPHPQNGAWAAVARRATARGRPGRQRRRAARSCPVGRRGRRWPAAPRAAGPVRPLPSRLFSPSLPAPDPHPHPNGPGRGPWTHSRQAVRSTAHSSPGCVVAARHASATVALVAASTSTACVGSEGPLVAKRDGGVRSMALRIDHRGGGSFSNSATKGGSRSTFKKKQHGSHYLTPWGGPPPPFSLAILSKIECIVAILLKKKLAFSQRITTFSNDYGQISPALWQNIVYCKIYDSTCP